MPTTASCGPAELGNHFLDQGTAVDFTRATKHFFLARITENLLSLILSYLLLISLRGCMRGMVRLLPHGGHEVHSSEIVTHH